MKPYSAYGLQIGSELSLPELLPGSDRPPDVRIRFGSVPASLPDPLGEGGWYQATADTFLLAVRDVARYLVVDWQEIRIERLPDCSEDLLRLYSLGSAFGALLHQRRLLVMHASAIQPARGAVLFVGPSGHGKSSLMGALVHRGYAMLADDVTAVTVEPTAGPVAFSAFPRLRLRDDTATRLGYAVDSLPHVESTNKYLVPVPRFCADPLPIRAIYALGVHAAGDILVETVGIVQRFAVVGSNTYRYNFLEVMGLRQMHFRAAARLAKAVHIGRITRPASPFLLDELVDRLEVEFGAPVETAKEKEASRCPSRP